MRLLRCIRSANPEGGGPIEGIRQMSRAQEERGHSVEILSLDSPEDEWVRNSPLRVHAMGPVRSKYGYAPGLVQWLRSRETHYDAIIVSGLWQYHSLAVWRAFRASRIPYYVFPHGMLDPWFRDAYPLKHLKKWLYWPWSDYRVLRDARAVLFTSEEERRRARDSFWLYRCRERVVNYGTRAPSGDSLRQRALFSGQFPGTRGKEIFLFLGRIDPKKGCDLLIRAFHKVLTDESIPGSRRQRLHLLMAGPDALGWGRELRAECQRLGIDSQVSWPGMLSGDLKWGAFRSAHAFVLPSHQENFGVAVAEALACGVPVLISDKVNIWREIEEDHAGLVGPDTEEGVLALLRRWIRLDDTECDMMRERAVQSFWRRYEITRAAENLIHDLSE